MLHIEKTDLHQAAPIDKQSIGAVEGSFSLKTGSFLLHPAPTSNLGLVTVVEYPTQFGAD